ncbi:hypothetical protein HKD37_04G011674 [Glycine soja]
MIVNWGQIRFLTSQLLRALTDGSLYMVRRTSSQIQFKFLKVTHTLFSNQIRNSLCFQLGFPAQFASFHYPSISTVATSVARYKVEGFPQTKEAWYKIQ